MTSYPLEKTFKVLNILNNRLSVSRAELSKECGLSIRSVYRYIDRLSEAGIPIYYDRSIGRYKLLKAPQFAVNSLNATDTIVKRLALHLLMNELDEDYPQATNAVSSLLERVSSQQSRESLTFQSAGYKQIESKKARVTEILNCSVLFEASLSRKKVRVYMRESENGSGSRVMRRPALKFNDRWIVVDLSRSHVDPISVEEIKEVRII